MRFTRGDGAATAAPSPQCAACSAVYGAPGADQRTAVELMECLELVRQGKIHAHVERFSLDDAPRAYEKMRAGELDGRAVICPNG